MTEKQVEKIKLSIKKHRAALASERRKYGAFDDSAGRRYSIADLYLRIADYKGAITYKKWFDKNFQDDVRGPSLYLNWSIAYFELKKMPEAKACTINTALKNVYLHHLLLGEDIDQINMYESGYQTLEYAYAITDSCRKLATKAYINWLGAFVESDEYRQLVNKHIQISKLLKDEESLEIRMGLITQLGELKLHSKA